MRVSIINTSAGGKFSRWNLPKTVKNSVFLYSTRYINIRTIMKRISLILLIIPLFLLNSCKQDSVEVTPASKAKTYYGESRPFGEDSIRSWIKTDVNGDPASIGVTFKQSAFDKLEGDDDTTFMMMLPKTASITSSTILADPFDHIEVDWSKKGDVDPPYNVAHFDVHFFCIDMMTQNAIMAGMDNMTMMMDTSYLPKGYNLMMDAEAMMGVHAMDTTDHDNPFNHTCMFGYSKGSLAFMEPMFAKTYIDSKTNFSAPIRQPSKFKVSGWYPTKYSLGYNSGTNEYTISIDGFTKH